MIGIGQRGVWFATDCMYVARAAVAGSHDLIQGDVVADLLRPKLPVAGSLTLVESGNKIKRPPAPAAALREADPNLRLISRLDKLALSLVLSNSCDNTGDYPLIFAPIRPFKFRPGVETEEDRWADISEAATGTATPRLFYLPGNPEAGFERSDALLSQMFSLHHDFVQRCLTDGGARVLCGLDSDALLHLRWSIAQVFARNPREDEAWPSLEDLRLKQKWLTAELTRGTSRRAEYEKELARINAILTASGS